RLDRAAFTLVETMVVTVIVGILIITCGTGITAMDRSSRRLADYTAAMSVVEAKMHSVRAATYNPPTSPFTASDVFLTNATSISLSKYGTNFTVSGTLRTTIQPVSAGHLVTVKGTFTEPSVTFDISLQSIINRYTTGQQ